MALKVLGVLIVLGHAVGTFTLLLVLEELLPHSADRPGLWGGLLLALFSALLAGALGARATYRLDHTPRRAAFHIAGGAALAAGGFLIGIEIAARAAGPMSWLGIMLIMPAIAVGAALALALPTAVIGWTLPASPDSPSAAAAPEGGDPGR